jgi:short-subunit dehydrogenase
LGRDQARLAAVAAACRQHGAEVESATIDVCARAEMRAWLEDFDRAGAVDLLIANAGVMTGRPVDGPIEPADASYGLMQINVLGVLNSVHPLLAPMIDRGRGQIAIVSSIAGFIPLPDSPSYSASKAAMINYGLALRHLLHSHGINVSVVCPGYVRTPMMAQETGLQPFALAPEAAAARIRRGLERNRAIIAFPFLFALLTRFGGLLPDRLRRRGMEPHRFTVAERAGDG